MDDLQTSYAVKLPAFEGPLDLLLHLIKKNEVHIYDIPIALITRQYLEYLDLIKSLNLAVAGDFLVMAATLIHIKSKMLLPPSETDEEEEDEDPRTELVMRLLEYQRFKDAAQGLEAREQEWREVFHRPVSLGSGEPTDEINLVDLSLFDLLEALRGVMQRAPEKKDLEIVVDALSVQERMGLILDRLDAQESITFASLFDDDTTRLAMVVTFLALLELIRLKRLRILQTELFGAIRIWKSTSLQPF
ncbi:MAG: segregation/condensation protein A [Nitrospirae bacterium]|nr:segregation/condensation protein A [Nitrospirota bacterium]